MITNRFRPLYELRMVPAYIALIAAYFLLPLGYLGSHVYYIFPVTVTILILLALRSSIDLIIRQNFISSLPKYEITSETVPVNDKVLYLGKGFKIDVNTAQAISRLRTDKNFLARFEKMRAGMLLHTRIGRLVYTALSKIRYTPRWLLRTLDTWGFAPSMKEVLGGLSELHGVGLKDEVLMGIKQANRNSHMLIVGLPGVGKTVTMVMMLTGDIKRGLRTHMTDPKGSTDIPIAMYEAASLRNETHRMLIVHVAHPDLSAKYNPLKNYSDISQVANRVISGLARGGSSEVFTSFSWRAVNSTVTALDAIGDHISYKTIKYYTQNPKLLLVHFCKSYFNKKMPDYYQSKIAEIVSMLTAEDEEMSVADQEFFSNRSFFYDYMKDMVSSGDQSTLLNDQIGYMQEIIYHADLNDEYFQKIVGSLFPLLSKITLSAAGPIFSFLDQDMVTKRETKEGTKYYKYKEFDVDEFLTSDDPNTPRYVYFGMSVLTNAVQADAITQAIMSDTVNATGRLYDESKKSETMIYVDEAKNNATDEYVTLLAMARGAGMKVTTAIQTSDDIEQVLGGKAAANRFIGNHGNVIAMRCQDESTPRMVNNRVGNLVVADFTPDSGVTDRSENKFISTNKDTWKKIEVPAIPEHDIKSLPIGQGYFITDGSQPFKIRIPRILPIEGNEDLDVRHIMQEINLIEITKEEYHRFKAIDESDDLVEQDEIQQESEAVNEITDNALNTENEDRSAYKDEENIKQKIENDLRSIGITDSQSLYTRMVARLADILTKNASYKDGSKPTINSYQKTHIFVFSEADDLKIIVTSRFLQAFYNEISEEISEETFKAYCDQLRTSYKLNNFESPEYDEIDIHEALYLKKIRFNLSDENKKLAEKEYPEIQYY